MADNPETTGSFTISAASSGMKDCRPFAAKFQLDAIDFADSQWHLHRDTSQMASMPRTRRDPAKCPYILESKDGAKFKGAPEGGLGGKSVGKPGYFVIIKQKGQKGKFSALPLDMWYNFKKERSSDISLEEAEQRNKERLQRTQETMNRDKAFYRARGMEEESDDEDTVKKKSTAVSAFDNKGGRKKKAAVLDDVLGDEEEVKDPDMEKLVDMDEELAEGWDFEDDNANEDVYVGADKEEDAEREEDDVKALEEEIQKDQRAKETTGHVVKEGDEDEEDFGYDDIDKDDLAEQLEEQKLDQEEKKKVKKRQHEIGKFLRETGQEASSSDSEDDHEVKSSTSPSPGVTPAPTPGSDASDLTPGLKRTADESSTPAPKRAKVLDDQGGLDGGQMPEPEGGLAGPEGKKLYSKVCVLVREEFKKQADGIMDLSQVTAFLKQPHHWWHSWAGKKDFLRDFVLLAVGNKQKATPGDTRKALLCKTQKSGGKLSFKLIEG